MMATRQARWIKRIVIIAVTLVLLVGAAEVALRIIMPNVFASTVRSELSLTEDHPVDVSLGGVALLSIITGDAKNVDIRVADAPLTDGIKGQIDLHADAMPLNPTQGEIVGGTAAFKLPPDQLDAAVSVITRGVAKTGSVEDDSIVVGATVQMFGQEVPITVSLKVSVANGDIVVEPGTLDAAGFKLTSKQIADFAGGSLDAVAAPRTVCLRDELPSGISLSDFNLSSTGSVTIKAQLAPTILSDPAQLENGVCE